MNAFQVKPDAFFSQDENQVTAHITADENTSSSFNFFSVSRDALILFVNCTGVLTKINMEYFGDQISKLLIILGEECSKSSFTEKESEVLVDEMLTEN